MLVGRLSRFTLVSRLQCKTAQDTCQTLIARLAQFPHCSVTADNGSESGDYGLISRSIAILFYFRHPYHSREKGTVENTKGLIGRYLPRHTDLSRIQQDDLDAIASELNHRPKKCLGFRTPYEVLFNVFVALSYWIHAEEGL